MHKVLSDIKKFNGAELETLINLVPYHCFDDRVTDYLNELSKELFSLRDLKKFPDLLTLAFFCRKANLQDIYKKYSKSSLNKIGRGIIFHVTPSNVPLNFAYSFIAGSVTGNTNIVRVPSKDFDQMHLFFNALTALDSKPQFSEVSKRSIFINYHKDSTLTEYFSSICDVRLIWGGDTTIDLIRKNKIPSRSIDITFADRYSFSVINAHQYLEFDNKNSLAIGFFNDTYLFDQNACTSPHLVCWLGTVEEITRAKEIFWTTLHEYVLNKYKISHITGVDKLTNYLSFKTKGIESKIFCSDNYLWRIELEKLPVNIDEYKGNAGYFFEYSISNLVELLPIINQKYQTLSYFGFTNDELINFFKSNTFKGIDRIVPIGKSADFSLTWDGYNLIEHLTRTVQII